MTLCTRRFFLIGSSAGLASATLTRFISFYENNGEPIIETPQVTENTLYICADQEFQIGLNRHPLKIDPPNGSLIDYLVKNRGEKYPNNPEDFEYYDMEYGYSHNDLEGSVPYDLWIDDAARTGPSADAYTFLQSLNIGVDTHTDGKTYNGLEFYDGPVMGSDYLGVHAVDGPSISLLQHRLNLLGANVLIKLV